MLSSKNLWLQPDELVTEAEISDCRSWENARERHEAVTETFPDRASSVVGADLFNTLFKAAPKVRPDAPSKSRAKFLDQLMGTADFMGLHKGTVFNRDLAAGGAIYLKERLEASPETREIAEGLDREESLLEGLQALSALSEELEEGSDDAAQVSKMIEDTSQTLQSVQADLEQAMDGEGTVRALRKVMKEVREEVEDVAEMAAGWGQEPGVQERFLFDPELRHLLGSDKLKKILDIAGRMRNVISAQRAKRPRKGPQKIEVEYGNDLTRVIPAEMGMLRKKGLRKLFLQRYIESGLQQYRYDEKPRLGKGPFVVVVDESGSMAGVKEQWAKGLTHALSTQAHKEHRPFGGFAFATANEGRAIFQPTPEEFVEWLGFFFSGGGTDFEFGIRKGIEMVEGSLPEADLIFITDGEADFSPAFVEWARERKTTLGIKIIGVQIGSDSLEPMKKVCDTVFRVFADMGIEQDKLEAIIQEMK